MDTACPLDCPDACTLSVTVQHGKLVEIDGSHKNAVTDGYICAKVRKFGDRVYGPDRLLYPAIRKGPEGRGPVQARALGRGDGVIVERMQRAKAEHGGASILPYSYGGSNGLLTQDNFDARLWRRFGTSRLARTLVRGADRRGQHGALRQDAVGHLPGLSRGRPDHPVGREPVGIGHPPHPVRSRGTGARREARRRRPPVDADVAGRRRAPAGEAWHRRRGGAGDPPASVHDAASPTSGSFRRTRTAPTSCARAPRSGRSRRRRRSPASAPADLERVAELYASSSPALIRCGWGLERNRNGGNAALAVLAPPDGRRQVRRPRRRLLDEQLGVMEHRTAVDRRAANRTRGSST